MDVHVDVDVHVVRSGTEIVAIRVVVVVVVSTGHGRRGWRWGGGQL